MYDKLKQHIKKQRCYFATKVHQVKAMVFPVVLYGCEMIHIQYDGVKLLHSKCQQTWKTQQWPQDWKRSVFIPISKRGNTKECSNYRTIALISHASKLMLKILQSRLQQYMSWELPDIQAGFKKGRGTRDQIANICWIIEKRSMWIWIKLPTSVGSKRIPEKHLLYWLCQSLWLCGSQQILWKIIQEMATPDHLTCLLRNMMQIKK